MEKRLAYISFGENRSDNFNINKGLPQGSSLSPYLFIVYHCDLIQCLGAHSGHLFVDDLSVPIKAPVMKSLNSVKGYMEIEGNTVCNKVAAYAIKWKQPINVQKTVAQIFYSQVHRPDIKIEMEGVRLEIVDKFKYLGFTSTSKMSLKPTVDQCLSKAEGALSKLKWLRKGKRIKVPVLRQCMFAYVFPHLAWIFPFYPFLLKTQRDAEQKVQSSYKASAQLPICISIRSGNSNKREATEILCKALYHEET